MIYRTQNLATSLMKQRREGKYCAETWWCAKPTNPHLAGLGQTNLVLRGHLWPVLGLKKVTDDE